MQSPSDFELQKKVRSIVAMATYTGGQRTNFDPPIEDPSEEEIVGTGLSFNTHVIPGNDDGPVPEKQQYATVLHIDSEFLGTNNQDVRQKSDGSGHQIVSWRTMRGIWSIQWYRVQEFRTLPDKFTPGDRAFQFEQWCESPIGREFIARQGLTFQDCKQVLQTDEVISFGWEKRAAVEFLATYQQTLVQDVNTISTIPFETAGHVKDATVWMVGQQYRSGAYVFYDGSTYRAEIDHTSSTENAPGTTGRTEWKLASPGILIIPR